MPRTAEQWEAMLTGKTAELVRLAREEERERCARIAEAEPECPGEMPEELFLVPLDDALRAAVRATKKSIAAAILNSELG